jgi:folylpolyglutamate synthase/dihydropteroate synthase
MRKSEPDDIILVTGSIFLVAEAREIIKKSMVDIFKEEHKRCLR